jgi:hypothetical protein
MNIGKDITDSGIVPEEKAGGHHTHKHEGKVIALYIF